MKKKTYKLILTEKQIQAIATALFEWAQMESRSVTGAKIARYLQTVSTSIYNQKKKQDQ